MNQILKPYDRVYYVIGMKLLGLYFFIPGIMKILDYQNYLDQMVLKGVPLAAILLPLTILIQVGLGLLIILGKQLRISALVLFGLTILINVFMHNFWSLQGDPSFGHEMQNFIKNLAIAAGLLVLAGSAKD